MSGTKKSTKLVFGKINPRSDRRKDDMHTQLDVGSNIGGIPLGYTSSQLYLKPRVLKEELLNNART